MIKNNTRPFLSLWFGNFFEPFLSDPAAMRRGIADIADLGFTTINLDSKPWEDFFARYRGEAASPYVAMHEAMMEEAARHGMNYNHLALYLCGDNLYPTIRDVPPVRGEEAILPNGQPMGTYKYWSPKAQQSMLDHVKGLLKLYGKGMARLPGTDRIIMQTMFEPIPKPSFDAEGRKHYLTWLENHYSSDIGKLNKKYGLSKRSFAELEPAEYWLHPEELNWVSSARPSADDLAKRTPDFYRWVDNQTYLGDVLQEYLATMKKHWREIEPRLFIEPVLHQWGYFFNPPGHTGWQTGQRAMDVYRCAAHVDGALFIASPLNADDRADALALSVEGSIMRCANRGREFTGGLYLGRHVSGDVYSVVSPGEAVATHVCNGAKRLHGYGYSGLDDGGVMYRMDRGFKDSLCAGIHWASEVMPLLDEPRTKEVAVLFPSEMSFFEPVELDFEGQHRMDLLGWYSQFVDLGWHVDILHPMQIAAGALAEYQHLVIPHNSLYDLGDNAGLEAAVRAFVDAGGTIFHGPHCELARRAFGIEEKTIPFDCIKWEEEIVPHGWSTVEFAGGTPVGTYIKDGTRAITRTDLGKGRVFSFGFQYGYAYCRRTMPIVPPNYGRREMHPIVLLKETPVAKLAGFSPQAVLPPTKGVEAARFGNHLIIVNHRSDAIDVSALNVRKVISLSQNVPGMLAAHSAMYAEL